MFISFYNETTSYLVLLFSASFTSTCNVMYKFKNRINGGSAEYFLIPNYTWRTYKRDGRDSPRKQEWQLPGMGGTLLVAHKKGRPVNPQLNYCSILHITPSA